MLVENQDFKVLAQFKSPEGENSGPPLNLPSNVTPDQLQLLLNTLLKNEEPLPYSFFVDDKEITTNLLHDVISRSPEDVFVIVYQPQAIFRVRSVTRCTSTLTGHTEAILSVSFSPCGNYLATASGDTTVRLWNLQTETPLFTLEGHTNWVQLVHWSPCGRFLVSGSMDKTVRIWNPSNGKSLGILKAHTQSITSIAFQPLHLSGPNSKFATTSRDCTTRIWDANTRTCLFTMAQHTAAVTCVRWAGDGLIYTASRDKTIKVWDSERGILVRTLTGHGHWINHLALSSDFILRTGAYDHSGREFSSREEMIKVAKERFAEFSKGKTALIASGSDDYSIFLWKAGQKQSVARLTGHQQLVNQLQFSPDGTVLASASFDKSVKLWTAKTGQFRATLKGHVGAVYQICWSPDSRMIVSSSRDSTCKVYELRNNKLREDLPGHADEVFAVDWSPAGTHVASGGKDCALKIPYLSIKIIIDARGRNIQDPFFLNPHFRNLPKMIFTVFLGASVCLAWGDKGHRMVGQIAQELLSPAAKVELARLLPEYNGNLENATLWADQIKKGTQYNWAYSLHFVKDSQSIPLEKCGYQVERDCPDGFCISGAIANFTNIAKCGSTATEYERTVAIKFLAHFLGDITQPLHILGYLRGGNDAKPAVFDGQTIIDGYTVNLHAIWDFHIVHKLLKLNYNNSQQEWLESLIGRIKAGELERDELLMEKGIYDVSKYRTSINADNWSMQSTKYNCEYAWPAWFQDNQTDFGKEYYVRAAPIVEQQIMLGGVRLAMLLNELFTDCGVVLVTDLPKPTLAY